MPLFKILSHAAGPVVGVYPKIQLGPLNLSMLQLKQNARNDAMQLALLYVQNISHIRLFKTKAIWGSVSLGFSSNLDKPMS